MPGPRSAVIVAAALLAATMTAGCSGSEAVVALDDSGATACAPADAEGRAVFGISAIQNASGSDVEVSGAELELVGADGMDLIGLELRAMDDPDAHLVGSDYDSFGPSTVALPHGMAAGETSVTLVGVRVEPGTGGSADAVALSFRGSDGDGEAETRIAMQVVPAGEVCETTG